MTGLRPIDTLGCCCCLLSVHNKCFLPIYNHTFCVGKGRHHILVVIGDLDLLVANCQVGWSLCAKLLNCRMGRL